jgi:nucleoside-diphosphate-sugar epimerase
MKRRVLVTGANGFVGNALLKHLRLRNGMDVVGSVRSPSGFAAPALVQVPELNGDTDWSGALAGVTDVVHCAARAHVMHETAGPENALAKFRRANVDGTLNLARQAAEAGVSRFVFISSVKVNGEGTAIGQPFRASDPPSPQDAYGRSKHEAELQLRDLASRTGMGCVIVRPPLVYGPGVKANFAALMRWLRRGIPLPLGSVQDNRRSLVALDNLVSLLTTCITHPAAANQTFLVSDGEDLSTADLLQRMARAQGVTARLLPVPVFLLQAGAHLVGKRDFARRLLGSLQVDIVPTCECLDWRPPLSVDEGLRSVFRNTEN